MYLHKVLNGLHFDKCAPIHLVNKYVVLCVVVMFRPKKFTLPSVNSS